MITLLLATVWSLGGYAQETAYKVLSFPPDNKDNVKVTNYTSTKDYTIGSDSWTISNFNNNAWNNSWEYIKCGSKSSNSVATISTKTPYDNAISSIVVNLSALSSDLNSLKLEMSSDKDYSNVIETISFVYNKLQTGNNKFEIKSPKENCYYRLTFDCKKNAKKNGYAATVMSVKYYAANTKTIPVVTFDDASIAGTTITINEGEESSFPTHVATCTTEGVTGTISYASDNACVTVDQNGKTAPGVGFGKAKITATFTPDDTYKDTYAESSAFYYIDYKEKEKTATTLSFENSSVALTTLDYSSFTGQKPTLKSGDTELADKSIVYSKTDADNVISALNEDGTLTLSGNAGTAIVKATFGGDSEYASSTASYTITVRKVYVTLADLKKDITSTEKEFSLKLNDAKVSYINSNNVYIEDASTGVLVYYKDAANDFKVGQVLNGEVLVKAKTYYSLNEITSWSPTSSYTVVDGTDIPLTTVTIDELVANYDKYESRRVKIENATVTTATTDARESGQISQDGSSITLRTNAKITTTKDDVIDVIGYPGIYNTGKQINVWSQDDIIVKGETSGTLNFVAQNEDGYYATFSSDKDVVFTNDVVVSGVSVASGKLSLNDLTADIYEVTDATAGEDKDGAVEGYYVPANTGVLVNSMDATATYYFPQDAQTVTLPANQLKAADGGVFTAEDGYKYYKLAYDNYTAKTGLGFYWGAENGGAFSAKAGTAYLAVPTTEANSAKSFAFNGGTTGIENVNVADNKTKVIYNLNGQRVESMSKAGLYIVNGKKVVVRK